MPGAWVREPCLHRWYLGGASQPNRPRQAVAGSERGQSQPPRRAVRSTHEPVFWRHCHCRITESRQRLTWPLRTQVWASLFSRSRPLGPMLPASARALWPFFVRSARPARHRARSGFATRGSLGVREFAHQSPPAYLPVIPQYMQNICIKNSARNGVFNQR